MSFVYSFQKILDMKEKEKEQAAVNYNKSVQALRSEEQRLAHLEQDKYELEQRVLQQESTSLAQLKSHYEYIGHLQRLIEVANESKVQAEKEVEAKQFILSERTIDQKIWEKLKEHSFQKYREKISLQEQKEMDEMAVARYYRQKVSPR
jgi:flagellar FliJ protein